MIVYQVVFRVGKYRIRKRTVRVKNGEFHWPGPRALHPCPEKVHKSLAAARRWQASKDAGRGQDQNTIGATESEQQDRAISEFSKRSLQIHGGKVI